MRIDTTQYNNIVILTGAGISAGSGLSTYRGPDGVWERLNVEEYGTIQTLRTRPEMTWRLFGSMRVPLRTAKPNAAHLAVAQIEANLRPTQNFLLVTQNIDGLHLKAGSKNIVEFHGNVGKTRCTNESCTLEPFVDGNPHTEQVPYCLVCGSVLRPDIVLFGEEIPALASWQSKKALRDCDLFLAIGTSGTVAPAANFVRSAAYVGARTIYVNLEPLTPENPAFKESYHGKAEEMLPELLGIKN